MIRILLISAFLFSYSTQLIAQSVLAEGSWFKMRIEDRGVYKLSYQYLKDAGVPLDNINPRTIKIFGYGADVVPQANDIPRSYDPEEIAIHISGEDDQVFNTNDYVLFYAQDGDDYGYVNGQLNYKHNIYSDENYYFITYGGSEGRRIESLANIEGSFPLVSTFDDFAYFEEENHNLLTSGREWYSRRYNTTTSEEFNFNFDNLVSGSDIQLSVAVMAQAFQESSFDISINNNSVGNMPVQPVLDFNLRQYRYRIKGYESFDKFSAQVGGASNIVRIGIDYRKNPTQSVGFLNYLMVEVKRNLAFSQDQMIWRSVESVDNPNSTFRITNTNQNSKIWNISDAKTPEEQRFELSGSIIEFNAESSTVQEYIIFDTQLSKTPASVIPLANQNLKSLTDVEFLIVSHQEFLSEASRLANFRMNNDNLSSKAVELSKVYNEFSGGRQDVSAIRDLAKYLYDNGKLKYLLLMGRGSYDYKDNINNNTNYVPIYESRNSLDPLDTYASDDYYGFLENNEGEWEESSSGSHTMDIGVGRIPATTLEEAKIVVDKIINYTTNPQAIGRWRNDVVFVADDGDFNLHQRQANELTVFVDTTYSAFQSDKFYLDNFPQISQPSGEISPAASEHLDDVVNAGALIVNFTGHGGETGWMQEQVLDIVQIQNWNNYNRLPLFVTATCEFGRHDDPKRVSAGELVVTSDKGGGVAIVSTCRPVSSASNFDLNKAFYEVVYQQENGQYLRLGDIFRLTKNNDNANKIGNRNFALLGDPTIRLAYPENNISITQINGSESKSDTLKALSKVKLSGEIRDFNNTFDSNFDGVVEFKIHDKEVFKTTLGNESAPFTYKSKENLIFSGSSTVTQGQFDIEFIVPKNISYEIGTGKINMYAYDGLKDANGSDIEIKVGGAEVNPPEDNEGPDIKLFIGDTLNTSLNQVSHNTNLVVILSDHSGINLSSFGVANNITATLDDKQTFILNDHYEAFKDTYQKGMITFPLEDLTMGKHVVSVKAWDTYNNSSESNIEFIVADPNSIVIYDIANIPNPFSNSTIFEISHNRAGENLSIDLEVISPIAGSVIQYQIEIENSPSDVRFFEWDGRSSTGEKLLPGIYIYKVGLRSIRDGAKNQAYKRLMLIN